MRELSRFAHAFDLGEHVALWHSLRMKPVFIERGLYELLQNGECSEELERELIDKKIFLSYEGEDEQIISRLRQNAPQPDVNLAYFILSEHCNLACKYCFVGSDACGQGISSTKDMTPEIAEKALDVFARQLEQSSEDYTEYESNIIFFGGEPLLKFDVLEYVARRVKELSESRPVLRNTSLAVITNGTLLNEERILKLDAMGVAVSISIDGFTEQANSMRVDKQGNETFERVVQVLETYKRLEVDPPSLSVTLTERTIEDLPSMLKLVRDYGVRGFGYNVLLKREDEDGGEYYEAASQFIIDSFLALREHGVYEDRIMRKLNAFAHSRVHFSDCGATSGGQILFAPDGRIGICQGLMSESENYVADIWDDDFIANEHPAWKAWSGLTAIHNDECLSCEALGICGGGCPVNARLLHPELGLHCIDERSCVHSKKTLEFLIRDLYECALADSDYTR
ncbi:FibroRumin system radical SAM peptide maturase [Ellagibacter isourolithinifaciens]|uniref:FibroRumin system radical SAM peptide maturase n=1 Tax=Ellagibacter isourolithinifaciens TaxID=2137581 RepID=UPI003AAC5F0D